jgi:hypothetical protein
MDDYNGPAVGHWVLLLLPVSNSNLPFDDFTDLTFFLTPVILLSINDSMRTRPKSVNYVDIALSILARYHTIAGSVTCAIPSAVELLWIR